MKLVWYFVKQWMGRKKKSDSSTRVITQQKYSLIFYYVQQLFKMNETQVTGFLNSFLLPKLFWPTVRKKLSLWLRKTFEIRGWRPRIYKPFSRTLEQLFLTVVQNIFDKKIPLFSPKCAGGFIKYRLFFSINHSFSNASSGT